MKKQNERRRAGVSDPVSTAKNCTFTVSGDRALVAKFKPVYVISVVTKPQDGGETEVDPVYETGELAKLKATPNDGYSFLNWTQNGVVLSTDRNFSFNVTGNRDLVANFAQGHRIDVSAVDWILQESPDLSPGSWVNSTRPVVTVDGQNQVSVPASGGGVFFRLARP